MDEAGVGALVAWLTAQLEEDKRVAQAASAVAAPPWRWQHLMPPHEYGLVGDHPVQDGEALIVPVAGGVDPHRDTASHIARWDPAAVLAVVQAMLDLLGEHCAYYGERPDTWFPVRVVSRLARAYRGRPGWRVEWDSLLVDL